MWTISVKSHKYPILIIDTVTRFTDGKTEVQRSENVCSLSQPVTRKDLKQDGTTWVRGLHTIRLPMKEMATQSSLLPSSFLKDFPGCSAWKESTGNVGDLVSIPGLGRSPGEGKVYPLQYSGLENTMDCIDYGVAKSRIRMSSFHFPVFLPGKSQGQTSLVGYSPWDCKELDRI